jgi:hypothetical protein
MRIYSFGLPERELTRLSVCQLTQRPSANKRWITPGLTWRGSCSVVLREFGQYEATAAYLVKWIVSSLWGPNGLREVRCVLWLEWAESRTTWMHEMGIILKAVRYYYIRRTLRHNIPWYFIRDKICSTKLTRVRLEVFTAVSMKNGVFWDVTPCGSCKNRRFGGT